MGSLPDLSALEQTVANLTAEENGSILENENTPAIQDSENISQGLSMPPTLPTAADINNSSELPPSNANEEESEENEGETPGECLQVQGPTSLPSTFPPSQTSPMQICTASNEIMNNLPRQPQNSQFSSILTACSNASQGTSSSSITNSKQHKKVLIKPMIGRGFDQRKP